MTPEQTQYLDQLKAQAETARIEQSLAQNELVIRALAEIDKKLDLLLKTKVKELA